MTGAPINPDERVQAKGRDFGVSMPVKDTPASREQDSI